MKGHIEIRRWFNGVATYYSARVHRFDAEGYPECVLVEPFAYGYGSHGANEAAKDLGFEGIGEAMYIDKRFLAFSFGETLADMLVHGFLDRRILGNPFLGRFTQVANDTNRRRRCWESIQLLDTGNLHR